MPYRLATPHLRCGALYKKGSERTRGEMQENEAFVRAWISGPSGQNPAGLEPPVGMANFKAFRGPDRRRLIGK